MGLMRAAMIAAFFIVAKASVLSAQEVTLTTPDGNLSISGTVLGFDGALYRLSTDYGELTVDGTRLVCVGEGCQDPETYVADVQISGSAALGGVLMPALIEAFALRNDLRATRETLDDSHFTYRIANKDGRDLGLFRFRVTTTDEGFADLLADEADIAMALREVRSSEAKLAREAGLGRLRGVNRSRVLALDALLPVVAARNPVKGISLAGLAQVLSGKIDNWQAFGGPDAPINLYLPEGQTGLSQSIEDRLLRPANLKFTQDISRHPTNRDVTQAVSGDPHGLGIASFSDLGTTRALTLIGTCGFSQSATRRSVKTEDYPLTTPLFLYLPARRLPELARDFLTFTRSQTAQIVIRRTGFVDQAPEEIPVSLQGDRFVNAIRVAGDVGGLDGLREMTQSLSGMRRLTTSFRFEPGSAGLDAQSRSNVQQLARALEAGRYDNRKLVFVGFSDGQGPADTNLTIAARRAMVVRDAVLSAAKTARMDSIEIETDAYGEAMPMACDDTSWGRQVNRRVEVWLQ